MLKIRYGKFQGFLVKSVPDILSQPPRKNGTDIAAQNGPGTGNQRGHGHFDSYMNQGSQVR